MYAKPFEDTRDCVYCGIGQVEIQGSTHDASGRCPNCGETNFVVREEELESDYQESLMDARRDRDW